MLNARMLIQAEREEEPGEKRLKSNAAGSRCDPAFAPTRDNPGHSKIPFPGKEIYPFRSARRRRVHR